VSTPELEILDIVDDQDRVIGSGSRQYIHENKLNHRSVHVLLFRSNGDLFLQKRAQWKDNCPGLWESSVSGHVDKGESYVQCAIREIDEEVGVSVPLHLEWLMKIDAEEKYGYEFATVYKVIYDGAVFPDPREIEDSMWLTPVLVDQSIKRDPKRYTNSFLAIWSHIRNKK